MDVKHLRLVKEVSENGSLTKAASKLHLSQSALSHQLREIEKQLGTSLFHRINKKLVLTNAGKLVLDTAGRVLTDLEDTTIAIKKLISGNEGSIKVTTECYSCYHWLPPLMYAFNKEFPKVDIDIHPEHGISPLDKLLSGKLDVAIMNEKLEDSKFEYTRLITDEMIALVHESHPWSKKAYVDAEDFSDQHVIIHSYPLEGVTLFRDVLIPQNIQPKKIIPIQFTEAALEMVKARMGIQVIAHWIVAPALTSGNLRAIKVTKSGLRRSWYAVTLRRKEQPQYLENFLDHLRDNIATTCERYSSAD
ncbi:MAG: LysR family transcriptional regulator for metE and metH [Cyclobacteriaceae bacterium]|jgi:LysR family transcriptional regulator for metE and metH